MRAALWCLPGLLVPMIAAAEPLVVTQPRTSDDEPGLVHTASPPRAAQSAAGRPAPACLQPCLVPGCPPEPCPVMPVPPTVILQTSPRLTDEQLGLVNDPAFEKAKAARTGGIVAFALGMGAALVASTIALSAWDDYHNNSSVRATAAYTALGTFIGSLAIGLPLWISGQSRVSAMRRERKASLMPVVSVSPKGASLGTQWQF